jgi:predicted metalloprotease with PDZ domain
MRQVPKSLLMLLMTVAVATQVKSQSMYQYAVDLNNVTDDKLTVTLLAPKLSGESATFYFPKIVPGTYMNSNYGRFVQGLKAFDAAGKALAVRKTDDNTWKISKAASIYKITYQVEDTWDSKIDKKPYSMCGTSFEAGKNFVLNTPGIFGYFEGKRDIPFELKFMKPAGFYAATGLKAQASTGTSDQFRAANLDELYDSPLMFSLPDTTSLRVGETDVLVAVYSPKKLMTSKYLADGLSKLLWATKDYLGGKLPVNKYAFIYYFNGEQAQLESSGAWEHSYSSFYSIPEFPKEQIGDLMIDISSHEFFHIVTPLTISSKEVKQFNFNQTILSKHLWLYEGSTEYYSDHVQVWGGLISPENFLESLASKIRNSRTDYNDSLSFTALSLESAGKYAKEYNNVYEKGALISASLDLLLLQRSGLQYSLKDLKHDLGVKYGKDSYFNDNDLFNEIEKLTWPEIKAFLLKYVEGSTPIPYEYYFGLAGVDYIPKESSMDFTLGAGRLNSNEKLQLVVDAIPANDETGKALGYKKGDLLVKLGNEDITALNVSKVATNYFAKFKEGDLMQVTVLRKNNDGKEEAVILKAPAKKIATTKEFILRMNPNPTPEQLKLRNKWLNQNCR